MGEVTAVIVILLLIVMVFVPLAYLNYTTVNIEEVKQTLSLSAKVLVNNFREDAANMGELARGYSMDDLSVVNIDRDKLLDEFDQLIYSNTGDKERFEKVKSCILLKALVLKDKFFITRKVEEAPGKFKDVWGPPFFFTTEGYMGNTRYLLNLNIKDNRVVYCDGAGNTKTDKVLNDIKMDAAGHDFDDVKKTRIILDKINDEIEKVSYQLGVRGGLRVVIKNPYDTSIDNKIKNSNVNILNGGITFFVVYGENAFLSASGKDFNFKNYNVVGYSMVY